jgi:hypothetical protein
MKNKQGCQAEHGGVVNGSRIIVATVIVVLTRDGLQIRPFTSRDPNAPLLKIRKTSRGWLRLQRRRG